MARKTKKTSAANTVRNIRPKSRMAGLDKSGLESRSLTLKGKEKPFDAWIYQA